MKRYDLIVAGGGISGVAAAVSAAREGISVLLIEKFGCLGGAMSNSCAIGKEPQIFKVPDAEKIKQLKEFILAE